VQGPRFDPWHNEEVMCGGDGVEKSMTPVLRKQSGLMAPA
jgi:hypothetical protein